MGKVRVRFLGSGDAFGSGGRFQTCIHVEAESSRFLLDCGASSLVAMNRFGVDPSSIEVVFISHLHGDHFGGIPFLILDGQFSHRTKPLYIFGPPGIEKRTRGAMEILFPGSSEIQQRFTLKFIELADGQRQEHAGLAVSAYSVAHASGAPSYALRIDAAGKIIAYSGDTEWTDALISAARGADLFICEAYFFEKRIKYHLDYRTLAHHRSELECQRIVLTHMSEEMLDRRSEVDFECAEDGKQILLQ